MSLLECAIDRNFAECDRIMAKSPSELNRKWEVELQGPPDIDARYPSYIDGLMSSECDSLDGNGDTLLHYAIRMNRCGPCMAILCRYDKLPIIPSA
jgi:hypothetical protein